jgi:DNA-binding MarR family transcriptional regulator
MTTGILVGDERVDEALGLIVMRLKEASDPASPVRRMRDASLLDIAKAIYRERRRRDRYLAELAPFGEPAWDILLDLYIAGAEDRRVSVNSACIAAAVPATTALRWLATLEQSGAVERTPDINDKRRAWVSLTRRCTTAMADYLGSLAGG